MPSKILTIFLLAGFLAATSTSSIEAEIPLTTQRKLQAAAPEKLLIEVADIRERSRNAVVVFEVTARVIKVEASDTGLEAGDSLTIRYWHYKPNVSTPAGSYPIKVKQGQRYRAYLGPPDRANRDLQEESRTIYFPTAASGSFETIGGNQP